MGSKGVIFSHDVPVLVTLQPKGPVGGAIFVASYLLLMGVCMVN